MKNYVLLICFMMTAGMVSAQALKVAADSNVGIGTGNPLYKLDIKADAGSQQLNIVNSGTRTGFRLENNTGDYGVLTLRGDRGDLVFSVRDISASTWNEAFGYNYENRALNVMGTIASFGNIISSDKKLKKNIKKFNKGLNEVLELNPVSYEYNGLHGTTDGELHIGILAQNLKQVVPEFTTQINYSEDDESFEKTILEDSHLGIKDNEIKWLLVNAIKEQQTRIEYLEEKLEELALAFNKSEPSINTIQLVDTSVSFIDQNTPNPFSDKSTINYEIGVDNSEAQIVFFNLSGQLIKEIPLLKGKGQVNLEAIDLPNGTYSYSLLVNGEVVETRKMSVVR